LFNGAYVNRLDTLSVFCFETEFWEKLVSNFRADKNTTTTLKVRIYRVFQKELYNFESL
jgi:hypothetical protein